jgi:deoxycytidylate deaminase
MVKITNEQIDIALQLANKSCIQKKFGALLIYKNKIISSGFNHHNGTGTGLSDDVRYCLLQT